MSSTALALKMLNIALACSMSIVFENFNFILVKVVAGSTDDVGSAPLVAEGSQELHHPLIFYGDSSLDTCDA